MILNSVCKKNAGFGGFKSLAIKDLLHNLGVASFFRAWGDFIFPPLCVCCKQVCRTCFFCPSCWDLCSPPDPLHRCFHCFDELYDAQPFSKALCLQCQKEPDLSVPYACVFEPTLAAQRLCLEQKEVPEAIAAFAMNQWVRLDWPYPHVVVPMPGAKNLAKPFALWLEVPEVELLSVYHGNWACYTDRVKEDQIFLLIDNHSSLSQIQKAVTALSEAFPKRIYVLSLYRGTQDDRIEIY